MFEDKIIEQLSKQVKGFPAFTAVLPGNKIKKFGEGKEQFKIIFKSDKVFSEILTKGTLGAGEQFMLGNLEIVGNLSDAFVTLFAIRATKADSFKGNKLFGLLNNLKPKFFTETRNKALRDISSHYDLSNGFYSQFLDSTMTYSCGYFRNKNDSLQKAQEQKYEHICRKLLLKRGETMVDVGCGWGGMMVYAAKNYGVKSVGITLAKEQVAFVRELIRKEKLGGMIEVRLQDYRDLKGQFDKFVSIGMFEHVTERYYEAYFEMIKKVLKPAGVGMLHTIGVNCEKGFSPDPWLEAYIFPGSYIPTPTEMMRYMARFDCQPQDLENWRLHYARTLEKWIENYKKVYDRTIKERGEPFARMWMWYLTMCRAGFIYGTNQLFQVTFTNGPNNSYPMSREHIYENV